MCSDKHDEICFEGNDCPLCGVRNELTELTELTDEKSQLEDKIEELNNTIEMMKENQK